MLKVGLMSLNSLDTGLVVECVRKLEMYKEALAGKMGLCMITDSL